MKGADSSGQGIGLAACAEIAAQAGYDFSVRPSPGGGNCFYLVVPRCPGPGVRHPD